MNGGKRVHALVGAAGSLIHTSGKLSDLEGAWDSGCEERRLALDKRKGRSLKRVGKRKGF